MSSSTHTKLAEQLHTFFRFFHRAYGREFLRAVSELELSLTQLKALDLLSTPQSEMSVKELARELALSFPAASRAVDGLYRRGLVERGEDPDDRRMKRVAITASGSEVVQRLVEVRLSAFEDLVSTLTDGERAALGDAMQLVLSREELGG